MLETEQIFFLSLPSEKLHDLKRPSQFTGDQVAVVTKVTNCCPQRCKGNPACPRKVLYNLWEARGPACTDTKGDKNRPHDPSGTLLYISKMTRWDAVSLSLQTPHCLTYSSGVRYMAKMRENATSRQGTRCQQAHLPWWMREVTESSSWSRFLYFVLLPAPLASRTPYSVNAHQNRDLLNRRNNTTVCYYSTATAYLPTKVCLCMQRWSVCMFLCVCARMHVCVFLSYLAPYFLK